MGMALRSLLRYFVLVFLGSTNTKYVAQYQSLLQGEFILCLSIVQGSKYIIRSDPKIQLYQINC